MAKRGYLLYLGLTSNPEAPAAKCWPSGTVTRGSYMSARPVFALLIGLILCGCHTTTHKIPGFVTLVEHYQEKTAVAAVQSLPQSTAVTALYQDAAQDAEIALALKDLRLLSLTPSPAHLLGIAKHHPVDNIQEKCGIRVLANPTLSSVSVFGSEQIAQMRQYAAEYNRRIFQACLPRVTIRAR